MYFLINYRFVLLIWLFGLTNPFEVWPNCELDDQCTTQFPYCPDCSLVECLPKWNENNHDCPGKILLSYL